LWVRPLEAATARLIPGSEDAYRPFWSPDSTSIAFAAGSVLKRVDLSRQTTATICDLGGAFWGGSWSSDGHILFAVRSFGIFEVPALGGTPSRITAVDSAHGEINHMDPQFLPDGRFLYGVMSADSQNVGIHVASLAKPADRVRLVANASEGRYAAGPNGEGYLLWIRNQTLVAQRFDTGRLQLIGEPHSLVSPAAMASAGSQVLLYGSSIALLQLKWLDRKGTETGFLGEPGTWVFNRVSPDGRRVVTVRAGDTADVWLLETDRGVPSRLTYGPTAHLRPLWAPNGRTILFSLGPSFNMFRLSLAGGGSEERVTESPVRQLPLDWSRDGRFVLYTEAGPDTGLDLWVLPVTSEGRVSPGGKPWPFVRERFDQTEARFSPDGRWVAYQSDESGRNEVYVRSFPEPREKLRISTGGGLFPGWGTGGMELFYQSLDGKLMGVALRPARTTLEASLPRGLFSLPTGLPAPNIYEVAPDGQHFLAGDLAAGREPLNVIVNWPALLKKK
jgi:Tol biopolymer transport system component